MPKEPKATTKSSAKSKTERSSPLTQSSAREAVKETVRLNKRSEKTVENYEGHIRRACKYFSAEVGESNPPTMHSSLVVSAETQHSPAPEGSHEESDQEFFHALEGKPIQCTPLAIATYLHFKCFDEGHGKSTAEAVISAFLNQYDSMEGDKYRGSWHYDDYKKEWVGNPARSAEVTDMLSACKNKDGEAERTHSRAMTFDDMRKLYLNSKELREEGKKGGPLSLKKIAAIGEAMMFGAFATTGFTIWTRNNETTNLQYKHLEFGSAGRRKGNPENDSGEGYFIVNLRNRKNWQKRAKTGQLQMNGHRYKIYPQRQPKIDMYSQLLDWLDFLESYLLQRPLRPEDHIFPGMGSNGTSLSANRGMTPNKAQKMITMMSKRARVHGADTFTTHCFRRGGAQYRFMYASREGEALWSLVAIRWWGGWAEGEHCDTLIRYLLDELYTYEEDYSDALNPSGSQALVSNPESALISTADTAQTLPEPHPHFSQLLNEMGSSIFEPSSFAPPFHGNPAALAIVGHSLGSQALSTSILAHSQIGNSITSNLTSAHLADTISLGPNPRVKNSKKATGTAEMRVASIASGIHFVPDIDQTLKGKAWLQVVQDWNEPDILRSHHIALKDWKEEWYKKTKESVKYGTRKMIALEFLCFGSNEENFRAEYPECEKSMSDLLEAIRERHQREGTASRCIRQKTRSQV
ncbi:hypothetical protein CPB83DRAFT_774378 [Crepidotus variabilis]|uniref:Tyr recombinase domain-containing protein n=1 Tax=Crepidotus variabilis TaxID=179855 RepID=A0A9P6E7J6_9AGAR|nr:hypothetical protein CPB83DRAFT_774378 [Crepidotus variabilis]